MVKLLTWFACASLAYATLTACGSDDIFGGGGLTDLDAGPLGGDNGDNGNGDKGNGDDKGDGNGGGRSEACRHVDVAIAVDGSSSMKEELVAMRDTVFPEFARKLPEISQGLDDFRVATLDACPTPADYHTRGRAGTCAFEGGKPWIDSTSSSLDAEFACVGDIFLDDISCSGDNDDEQPASTLAASLEAPFFEGANAGFSRDESLLVMVAITDEDEQPTSSAETAQAVYNRLINTKGGDVKRMVFLGIGGGRECSGVYGGAEEAKKLREITDLFVAQERGVWWDLCDGELQDGLAEAFRVIETACNELPEVECEDHDDCKEAELCERGVCREPPGECIDSDDCQPGEYCEDGQCFRVVE